jgi:uncharacterized protein involved in exopolysaccharide biosynthesis
LNKAVDAAQASLSEIAKQIEQFEFGLGSSLGDLRNLVEPTSGDNQLYKNLNQINTELRAAEVNLETVRLQRTLLQTALDGGEPVVATPNELFDLQPALRRIKEGLIDGQLQLAELRGDYHDNHPKVVQAIEAVEGMKQTFREELDVAIRGLDDQIRLIEANVAQLTSLATEANVRLQKLTELRVVYDQLNEEFKRRDAVLRDAQTAVAQAQSIRDASQSVDLLTRVNEVQVASRPEGMSKRALVGSTTLLGLFIGLGLVVLLHGPQPQRHVVPAMPPPMPAFAASPAPAPSDTPQAAANPGVLPRETIDQVLERGSFAVTVMPSSFLLSKPHAD